MDSPFPPAAGWRTGLIGSLVVAGGLAATVPGCRASTGAGLASEAASATLQSEEDPMPYEAPPRTVEPIRTFGLITWERGPGYRSPYRLLVSDPEALAQLGHQGELATGESLSFELHGDTEQMDALLGKIVVIEGIHIVHPGGPAEPGSEAAMRFIDGMIPTLSWVELETLVELGPAQESVKTD